MSPSRVRGEKGRGGSCRRLPRATTQKGKGGKKKEETRCLRPGEKTLLQDIKKPKKGGTVPGNRRQRGGKNRRSNKEEEVQL